jgi:hypothetical protein
MVEAGSMQSKDSTAMQGSSITKSSNQPDKKKFSFLHRLQGPVSSNAAYPSNNSSRRASAPGKLDSADFVSFSSAPAVSTKLSQSTANSLQALSKGLMGGAKRDFGQVNASAAAPSGTMTLLELEALNKKKRRKSVGPNSN